MACESSGISLNEMLFIGCGLCSICVLLELPAMDAMHDDRVTALYTTNLGFDRWKLHLLCM